RGIPRGALPARPGAAPTGRCRPAGTLDGGGVLRLSARPLGGVSHLRARHRSICVSSGPPPFQRFLDSHRDAVWRFLVASVGPAEAEDCFQETFIAALRAYPRLRPRSNLRAWVLTIAHRKALDAHRARARRAQPVADLLAVDGRHAP